MAHDARLVADCLLDMACRKGQSLSIVKLLRIIFISHGWTLALLGRPLVQNAIEAWDHGPVITDVYAAYRSQGTYTLRPDGRDTSALAMDERSILDQTLTIYGTMDDAHLSDLVRKSGSPWDLSRQAGGRSAHIPDALIDCCYRETLRKSR